MLGVKNCCRQGSAVVVFEPGVGSVTLSFREPISVLAEWGRGSCAAAVAQVRADEGLAWRSGKSARAVGEGRGLVESSVEAGRSSPLGVGRNGGP